LLSIRTSMMDATKLATKLHSCHGMAKLTEEQVVGVRYVASNLKYFHHVKELPVYVSNDGDRSFDVDDIALFHEQLLGFGAYCLDDGLG
jgi:hypothetical protein